MLHCTFFSSSMDLSVMKSRSYHGVWSDAGIQNEMLSAKDNRRNLGNQGDSSGWFHPAVYTHTLYTLL